MRWVLGCLTLLAWVSVPLTAAAGGNEFPSGGTRGLGRGATGFARADDPTIMARNPALLADLWDDQAMSGAQFLFVDACFHPTGGFTPGSINGSSVVNLRGEKIFVQAPDGATDLEGNPLEGFLLEPYPISCYTGPMPILPQVALARKLSSDFGVGLGFFPPDVATLHQWGDRDGIIETKHGLRPNPARYFRSHLNVSFFSALAAAGYRVSDFLRVGAAFQWNVVAFESTTFARPIDDLSPNQDVRVETFGRDLFIPAFVISAHVVPIDALDFAVGFKWADRVESKAKLDLTTGAFGVREPFRYLDEDGMEHVINGTVPTTMHNQPGSVSSPPISAPQLTFAVRYAQRLKPRVKTETWKSAQLAAGPRVEDSMANERWDIEFNAVVYFNSVSDEQVFASDARGGAQVSLVGSQPGGIITRLPARVGSCTKQNAEKDCIGQWEVPTLFRGKDQLSLRLGGDYNILPGLLAVRAGVSHETDGQDVEFLNITNYMLGRTGLHLGATVRIADKTDFSIGFAHFIQKDVRLNPNPKSGTVSPFFSMEPDKYNYHPDQADGIGRVEVAYGGKDADVDGPNFVNVGSYFYDLDVLAVQLSQHF
jgi:hypothetical protein